MKKYFRNLNINIGGKQIVGNGNTISGDKVPSISRRKESRLRFYGGLGFYFFVFLALMGGAILGIWFISNALAIAGWKSISENEEFLFYFLTEIFLLLPTVLAMSYALLRLLRASDRDILTPAR